MVLTLKISSFSNKGKRNYGLQTDFKELCLEVKDQRHIMHQ